MGGNQPRMSLRIGDAPITIEDVVRVARQGTKVTLSQSALRKVARSRTILESVVKSGKIVYGVNTGFGKLAEIRIPPSKAAKLQENLIRSHASGVGEPFPEDVVRAAIFLRLVTFLTGYCGVTVKLVDMVAKMLNQHIVPIVPEKGSLGASGDLAPSAHIALVMIGRGEAMVDSSKLDGAQALRRKGLNPIRLKPKEGISLINGTQVMTAIGALVLHDSLLLLKTADIAAAMTLEALEGSLEPFDEQIQKLRPYDGQLIVAQNISRIVAGSGLVKSTKDLQDPFSLRCVPQVHGAIRECVSFSKRIVETEINSVTDNPIVVPEKNQVLSGGNFHGQPVSMAMDLLALSMCQSSVISGSRIERLLNPMLSGLPAFLSENSGLHSGLMITQYVAQSLISENRVLSHPASIDHASVSAGQEDHASMGTIAARKAKQILDNAINVIAIELLAAAQALEFRKPTRQGKGTAAAYQIIRESVSPLHGDRELHRDVQSLVKLLKSGALVQKVGGAVGSLS